MLASLLAGLLVSYCIDFSYLVIHSPSHPMFIAAVISIAVDGSDILSSVKFASSNDILMYSILQLQSVVELQ